MTATTVDEALTSQEGARIYSRHEQPFLVRKRMKLGGMTVQPGDVVDLAPLGLPPGRVRALETARYGERVGGPDPAKPADLFADLAETTRRHALRDTLIAKIKPELITMCKDAGLPIYGSKADMADRLIRAGATEGLNDDG